MNRRLSLCLILLCVSPALAQEPPAAPADPDKQALAYQLQLCRQAGDQAMSSTFRLAARLEAETRRADAEKKRADEAEAKLKAFEKPAEGK